jgi:hypothetical protein
MTPMLQPHKRTYIRASSGSDAQRAAATQKNASILRLPGIFDADEMKSCPPPDHQSHAKYRILEADCIRGFQETQC